MNEGVFCHLRALPAPEGEGTDTLHMSKATAARLGLRDGGAVALRTLRGRAPLRVVASDAEAFPRFAFPPPGGPIPSPSEGGGETVYLSRRWLHRLHLPAGAPLQLVRAGVGEVHVGPVVGIFCQRYPGPALYGPQTRFFRRLIEIGRRRHMFVYVFEGRDVDRRTETVAGFTWTPNRGWVRRPWPLPHVFYDRGMVTDGVMRIHRWLRLRGVRQFNGYVGSKLWVYRLLADVPELARYIPPTRVLRRTADLVHMVKEHGVVYIKSAGGGKGIGIWVVAAHPRRGYTYRFTDAATRVRGGATRDARTIVQRLLAAPRQPWFIQPRIDLLQWRDRIFDVRVLVQRDGEGRLRVTGTGARVGRKGGIVSNIHGGGQARALAPLLQQCLSLSPARAAAMQAEIEEVALSAAQLIDRAVRGTGTVGELGVDIAVDRRGGLWFLEANSRTGRNVFVLAGMADQARQAMERPLAYAAHVAGFGG